MLHTRHKLYKTGLSKIDISLNLSNAVSCLHNVNGLSFMTVVGTNRQWSKLQTMNNEQVRIWTSKDN